MSPRDRSPVRTPSPRQPSRKDHWYPVESLQSDFAAVGTNFWFVWPEGNWPPDWAWFLPRFFLRSVTDGVLVPCRRRLWLAYFGTLHFQQNHRLDCRYYLNWTEMDDAITKFNNEIWTEKWVLNLVILHYWHTLLLFWYCAVALLQFVLLKALHK